MPSRPSIHSATPANAKAPRKSPSSEYVWQKFRRAYAARVPAVCVRCGAALESKLMALDHITPLEQGGARFDENNLQWLCVSPCHNAKTATEDNGFGRLSG